MATGMPELGSKISLISKADIRYEGRLFTVDPSECTIALANVRSYGTEDRETQYPIAPQNQVYDYILFRGSDIKDIRVVNNVAPIPQDPAIMQMQMHPGQQMMGGVGPAGGVGGFPGQQQPQQFQPQQQMGQQLIGGGAGSIAMMGGGAGALGGFNAMGGLGGPLGPGGMGGMAPGASMSNLHKTKQTTSVMDLIGGSRSTTPISMHSRKSPEMGLQRNQQQQQAYHGNNQQPNRGWNNNSRGGPQQQQLQGMGGNGMNPNQMMRGQRGQRGGRGPMNQGGYRQSMHQQNNPNKGIGTGRPPKTTIKFEGDYDFEQANNKFEELRLELAKLKVGDEAKPEQVNGEADKKDDSGNETGAGEHEQEDDDVAAGTNAPGSNAPGYDKAKSFFDNISCEAANDRTKGKNRTDWRHERKINSETFGVSARRGGFFNFRGRGGFYNRNNQNNPNQLNNANQQGGIGGPSGGAVGGYRQNNNSNGGYRQNNNGYRGPRNYNNRGYQHQNQSTGIPVQPTTNKQQQPAPQQQQSEQKPAESSSTNAATSAASGSGAVNATSSGAASSSTAAAASAAPIAAN